MVRILKKGKKLVVEEVGEDRLLIKVNDEEIVLEGPELFLFAWAVFNAHKSMMTYYYRLVMGERPPRDEIKPFM